MNLARVSISGKTYSDPDVLALIYSRADPVNPREEVLRRARALNEQLRQLGPPRDPRQRLEILASLAGITVAPMATAPGGSSKGEALIYRDADGTTRAYYDRSFSDARINFSIAHEIVHTFFPNSVSGARFRAINSPDSREANELERLCDVGAAELIMPADEFNQVLGSEYGLATVPRLAALFGTSYEATVYRLASAATQRIAIAGLLRHRFRKDEIRKLERSRQQSLFDEVNTFQLPVAKYRRQSLHLSALCADDHVIPWNKSFEEHSCVYAARIPGIVTQGRESLPNRARARGRLEAIAAPYQRPNADSCLPDVLFLWWID